MAKEPLPKAPQMSDLNAEITTQSLDLLKLAKIATRKPLRLIVQEAIDAWLKLHGYTPDKLPNAGKPRH